MSLSPTAALLSAAALLGPVAAVGPVGPIDPVPAQDPIVLRNVTLIDVAASEQVQARRPHVTVVLSGDRVAAIGPTSELPIPAGATVVDGSGKYLIPGLFDMHVHLSDLGDGALTAMVVHGVTSARDLGGDIELLDEALARVEAGELVGPRVARAGYVLEARASLEAMLASYEKGDTYAESLRRTRIGVASEADARAALARIVDSGADVLKFRTSPDAELLRLIVREARAAGLRVAGHEPGSIDIAEAAALGVGSLEHFALQTILANTSPERWGEIHAAMVEHGMHATPTYFAMRNAGLTSEELQAALDEERGGYRWSTLSPRQIRLWEESVPRRIDSRGELDWDGLCARGEASVRAMHEAGVPLLAGTDLGLALLYPGLSLHDELLALVERAGLSPLESLRAATANAASWLGWDDLGSIHEGGRADLVLLDADPLEDIAYVGHIHAVVSRGVYYGPEERERLIAEVAERAVAPGSRGR